MQNFSKDKNRKRKKKINKYYLISYLVSLLYRFQTATSNKQNLSIKRLREFSKNFDRMNWIGKSKRCYFQTRSKLKLQELQTYLITRIRTHFLSVVVAAAIYILYVLYIYIIHVYIIWRCSRNHIHICICNNNSNVKSENWIAHEKVNFLVNQELIKLKKRNPLNSNGKTNQKYSIKSHCFIDKMSIFSNICSPILFHCLFCVEWTVMIIVCQSVDLVNRNPSSLKFSIANKHIGYVR